MPNAALLKAGRCGGMVALLIAMATSALAQSETTARDRGNRLAYAAAQKCFVVIGVLVGDAKDSGKSDLAGQYDQKARRSFDFALQLGAKLGLSGTTMNEDFGLAQAHELPKLIADKSYFSSSADTCKALGLL